MTTRRFILGLVGAAVAAPKAAGNAILSQATTALGAIASDGLRYGGGYAEDCASAPTPSGLLDMMSVAEKTAVAAHEAIVEKAERDCSRRRYHRQFLHSMSPAAKRAYDSIDRDTVRSAEGPMYALMEKLRGIYEPDWKSRPERTLNAARLTGPGRW